MTELSPMLREYAVQDADALPEIGSTTELLCDFITTRLPQPGEPLADAAAHHFAKPGKMLRAKMALRAANALNVDRAAGLHWAVAIEVLHNASLIHDDICDGDRLRRGRPAVWSKFGRDVALALGDWLIALSFELAAEAAQRSQTPMLVKILAGHMKTTTLGEAREFDIQRNCDWKSYLQIAADKTAPLLTAPLQGVATMALHTGASTRICSYFRCLGNAYQVANDMLNFSGDDGAETSGSDLARRAPNAVVVLFRDQLDDATKSRFDSWYASGCTADVELWREAILESSAIKVAAVKMYGMLDESERLAATLPPELRDVIQPVWQMLQQVCQRSASQLSQNGSRW
jgi:geranylgeranyl pyrophosphate synthase